MMQRVARVRQRQLSYLLYEVAIVCGNPHTKNHSTPTLCPYYNWDKMFS